MQNNLLKSKNVFKRCSFIAEVNVEIAQTFFLFDVKKEFSRCQKIHVKLWLGDSSPNALAAGNWEM